jgi:hypothetical protein
VRHRIAIRLSNLSGEAARTITVTERVPVSELPDKVEVVLRPVDAWQPRGRRRRDPRSHAAESRRARPSATTAW